MDDEPPHRCLYLFTKSTLQTFSPRPLHDVQGMYKAGVDLCSKSLLRHFSVFIKGGGILKCTHILWFLPISKQVTDSNFHLLTRFRVWNLVHLSNQGRNMSIGCSSLDGRSNFFFDFWCQLGLFASQFDKQHNPNITSTFARLVLISNHQRVFDDRNFFSKPIHFGSTNPHTTWFESRIAPAMNHKTTSRPHGSSHFDQISMEPCTGGSALGFLFVVAKVCSTIFALLIVVSKETNRCRYERRFTNQFGLCAYHGLALLHGTNIQSQSNGL
mmetsp:Transcript_16704/g.24773  ORF Transcript_16704/g.24773 Transcript_16704/m.24773 type:complete len:271 (-) Transcript_16704:1617-2429(-)